MGVDEGIGNARSAWVWLKWIAMLMEVQHWLIEVEGGQRGRIILCCLKYDDCWGLDSSFCLDYQTIRLDSNVELIVPDTKFHQKLLLQKRLLRKAL